MSQEPSTTSRDLEAENAELRAKVEVLEAEIVDLRTKTAQTLAKAQESLYWFDRWGVDFNSVMSRPQAEQVRQGVRGVRKVYRRLVHFKRGIDYRLGR